MFEMEPDEYMRTSEVADFYNVAETTINYQYTNHKEAFMLDGTYENSPPDATLVQAILEDEGIEVLNANNLPSKKYKPEDYVSEWDFRLYPKRSVLRMATLLRPTSITKAVCEQLLNLSEVDFRRSSEIKKEIYLLKNIRKSIKSKCQDLVKQANEEYQRWRNRNLFSIRPYFPQEYAIAALYSEFGMTYSTVKWRVLNQLIPCQLHKQDRTHREALIAAVRRMAKQFHHRDELTDEELHIIMEKYDNER
ncbi:MAG: hypothetical protein NC401_09770 [Ruminococcus sp.]|nr:hypothetical protein [Ruminococcus sp.]